MLNVSGHVTRGFREAARLLCSDVLEHDGGGRLATVLTAHGGGGQKMNKQGLAASGHVQPARVGVPIRHALYVRDSAEYVKDRPHFLKIFALKMALVQIPRGEWVCGPTRTCCSLETQDDYRDYVDEGHALSGLWTAARG